MSGGIFIPRRLQLVDAFAGEGENEEQTTMDESPELKVKRRKQPVDSDQNETSPEQQCEEKCVGRGRWRGCGGGGVRGEAAVEVEVH